MEAIKADFLFLKKNHFNCHLESELEGLEQVRSPVR